MDLTPEELVALVWEQPAPPYHCQECMEDDSPTERLEWARLVLGLNEVPSE